jgi:flagellar basal-body rod protein FlgC
MSDSIFAIARSGMDVERQRLNLIAENLANAGSAGTGYAPLRLISGPVTGSFAQALATPDAAASTAPAMPSFSGVRVYGVQPYEHAGRKVYEPGNPKADDKGYVTYPGIDHAGEMSLMVQTLRIYEANVAMYNAGRSMFMRALDIGAKA